MLNLSAYALHVNGVLTRVLEAGSAGTPVVFVHGAGGRAERWARSLEAGAQESLAALGRYVATQLDDDVVGEQLAASGLPVLLLWGERDRSVALSVGEAAARLIPGARLVVLPQAGHAPYLEKPEAFNRALIEFLSGS